MKQKLFKHFTMQRAPKITSRRVFGNSGDGSFRTAAYKTDGTDGGGDDADPNDKRTEQELLAAIDERIEKALATRATVKELKEIKDSQSEML